MTSLVASVIILMGAVLIFSDELARFFRLEFLKALLQKWLSKAKKMEQKTLRQKLRQMESGHQDNFILQSYRNMSAILNATGEESKLKTMRVVSLTCGAAGVFVSVYVGSWALAPILGVGFALLPMWLLKFKAYRYNVSVMNELSVVLSMVTNSYVRCENMVKAVEENIVYMNHPVKAHFESFVYQCTYVNSNVSANIQALRQEMDNAVFRLWCDCLVICQSDINQKSSLNAVVEQFTTDRELLNLLSAEITKPVQIFAIVAAITFTAFPLTSLMGTQFGIGNALDILFGTLVGQCVVVGYAIVLFFGINRAIDLSTKL